ncbi:autotransporter family protein [Pseudochrobactrum sp. HB0163]|uniref:autotransporter family protein n=1 Tax=Pseudochrobactrum sp. HB0163 TaxID=3450708 RepID=UPI003F6DD199
MINFYFKIIIKYFIFFIFILLFSQKFSYSQTIQINNSTETVFLEDVPPAGSTTFEIGSTVSVIADINNTTSNAIQSDNSQDWTITNYGLLHGTGSGVGRGSGMWIDAKTFGSVLIDNHGTIIGDGKENLGEDAGISLRNGGTINNSETGVIIGAGDAVHMLEYSSLNNKGFIQSTGNEKDFSAVYFFAGGKLNNTGIILGSGQLGYGVAVGTSTQFGPTSSSIINSGTITGGVGFLAIGDNIELHNSGVIGSNQANGHALRFLGKNNILHLTTGSQLNGSSISDNVNNHILLTGTGSENDQFNGFDTLTMDGNKWDISGDVTLRGTSVSTVMVKNGDLGFSGNVRFEYNGLPTNGGATIANGAFMHIGNGGSSGSLSGDIHNNGSLFFNRSNQLIYDYTIDGGGTVYNQGAGITIFTKNNIYTGSTIIKSGGIQLGNGGIAGGLIGDVENRGRFIINRSNTFEYAGHISGDGYFDQIGAGKTILSADSSGFLGVSSVQAGILAVNGSLGGVMHVFSGRLQGGGIVGPTTLEPDGIIAPGNDDMQVLTVNGKYLGNGGLIIINTVLGDDSSPTSMLSVIGKTSGTSTVSILNHNGKGAQTQDGIKIIEVKGESDAVFNLRGDYVTKDGQQAVVAGAYSYTLHKNSLHQPNDGNWYLRSNLNSGPAPAPTPRHQPGVPVYETYPQALLELNGLSTLQQRIGNRFWAGRGNKVITEGADAIQFYDTLEEAGVYVDGNGTWGQIIGNHNYIDPRYSTSSSKYQLNEFRLKTGLDGMLSQAESSSLVGGIFLQYVTGKTKINSVHGDGDISTDGYGLGGTLTWYSNEGFYIDGQAQATWYNSNLSSTLANIGLISSNKGFGYALSVESGKRFIFDQVWSITPQAQLVYSNVRFNSFDDVYGVDVSLDSGESLQSRFSITLDRENSWQNAKGLTNRNHIYGITNIYYEFIEGTRVDVAGTSLVSDKERLWGGLGFGGSYNWNNDKYSIYGEGIVSTSLNNFGNSYTFKGNIAFRVKW